MRRWRPNTEHTVNGLRFRVVVGQKQNYFHETVDDYVLEVLTSAGWRKVHMHLVGFITDFLTENEDILFPRYRDGFRTRLDGGYKLIKYLTKAWQHGWQMAEEELQRERSQKSLFDEDSIL